MIVCNYPRRGPRWFLKMEIITLSDVEISYHGGGDDKSKHTIQLVFTSESFQLLVAFCCDLPEMKWKKKKKTPLEPAGGRAWGIFSFKKCWELVKSAEKYRRCPFSCQFQLRSFPGKSQSTPLFPECTSEDQVRPHLGWKGFVVIPWALSLSL